MNRKIYQMKTVVMTVNSDLEAWGSGATKKNMPRHQAAYCRVAKKMARAIFGSKTVVSIDFVPNTRSSAIIDGVIDANFCDQVWREFCAK